MSIAPPGYPTDETDPGGSRQPDDNVQYELKSVQALRGRESRAKAKWHNQGWEFVSENRGALRTELNFRRVKPKTIGGRLLGMVAAFRRLQPKTRSVLVASCAVILVAGGIGIVVGTQIGGDTPDPSAARTTASTSPPAEPTVTGSAADEVLDDAVPSETSKPSERRTKARAHARAKARARTRKQRREASAATPSPVTTADRRSANGRAFTNCDAARAAGAAPLQRGTPDYEANTHLDRDEDGVACES
jgi:hypothetical protein